MQKENNKIIKQKGSYILSQGDCMELMKNIKPGSVDCVIIDPPYGINFLSGRRSSETKHKRIKNDDNLLFLLYAMYMIKNKMKENAHIYCFCSWHNVDIFKENFEKLFSLKNILIWQKKNNISMGDLKRQYAPKYEMCLYGTKGKGHELYGKREADILCFSRTNNEFHPTEKPVKLIEYLIQHSTKQGDIVLDAFAGSFSTGVACINTNRKFIGIEIDPKYFEIGKQRMEQAYKMQKDYGEW